MRAFDREVVDAVWEAVQALLPVPSMPNRPIRPCA